MKEIVAIRGQSLMDIALQHSGDASEAHALAEANGLADDWVSGGGEVLSVPMENGSMVKRLEREGVVPCSGEGGMMEGIGYDVVGYTMIG